MQDTEFPVRLTDAQAIRVARFFRRLQFGQLLELCEGRTDEAYETRNALHVIALELARKGYD